MVPRNFRRLKNGVSEWRLKILGPSCFWGLQAVPSLPAALVTAVKAGVRNRMNRLTIVGITMTAQVPAASDLLNLGNKSYLIELFPMAAYAVGAPHGVIAWFNSRAAELW